MNGAFFNQDRGRAALGVVAGHALLGYALITGLAYEAVGQAAERLKLITLEEPPPPPAVNIPPKERTEGEEGAASPTSLAAKPTPVVAPPPVVKLDVPPPIATVPEATPVDPGTAPNAGVSTVDGPGSGTGGIGIGTGSGDGGSGTGGGGARSASRIRGALANADYPRSALKRRAQGSVAVRYTVEPDGRVTGCRVIDSSGHADLDATTCRLIERRFVYRPARDGSGRPIRAVITRTYDWMVPGRS